MFVFYFSISYRCQWILTKLHYFLHILNLFTCITSF